MTFAKTSKCHILVLNAMRRFCHTASYDIYILISIYKLPDKPTKRCEALPPPQVELLTFYDRHSGMNKILPVFCPLVARTIQMICKSGKLSVLVKILQISGLPQHNQVVVVSGV